MVCQPRFNSGGLAIRQKVNHTATLQIADDAAVPVTSPPSPIVDPNDAQPLVIAGSVAPDDAEQSVFAHRQHQPPRQRRGGTAAQSKPEMADDFLKPRSAPRRPGSHRCTDWLGEYAAVAIAVNAAKAPDRDLQLNRAPMRRKVKQPPLIMAVHAFGSPSATGTKALNCPAARRNTDPVRRDLHFINQQADGRQRLKALKYHWRHPE
jgi:hypothetical protein